MRHNTLFFFMCFLGVISMMSFLYFFLNGIGLSYNDARSHLDIGRRLVDGLRPGFAQLGSVWLPLPHLLMLPTIWSDFMWHSGLSGALQSMVSYIITGLLIYKFLQKIRVGMLGRIVGVLVFALNANVLYLQSTAMTELLLIATMTAAALELLNWHITDDILNLVKTAFWIMLSTLIRYDGWFLFIYAIILIAIHTWKKHGYKATEGTLIFFCTLAGFGIVLWFAWNLLIFNNPFYFATGPFSAHEQQLFWERQGKLPTKGNLPFSLFIYSLAVLYTSGVLPVVLAIVGGVMLWRDKTISLNIRIAATAILSPFLFNIIALYLGHSILFIPELLYGSWYNVRYAVMMVPTIAILIGYLVHRAGAMQKVVIGLLAFVTAFSLINKDSVVIDDATGGFSSYNVNDVSEWLGTNTKNKEGFILISTAAHDPIVFTSGLPISKFIFEGSGEYYKHAIKQPNRWARWVVMRSNDTSDATFFAMQKSGQMDKYRLVGDFHFADVYELKPEYFGTLNTKPVLTQK